MKISACIITFNEENNIAGVIESVSWADEILIVDSHSTDRTREVVASFGVKVLLEHWRGFAKQKQFAADSAQNEWIFSIDADERVSERLKNEILELKNLSVEQLADGYKIPRQSFYMNRAIRHGGWYPDWQMRFFNRGKGSWNDFIIHESFQLKKGARSEKLCENLLHYSFENAAQHHRMIGERYAPLAARQMFEAGRRTSPLRLVTVGLTTFLQTYILKLGFLDGLPGFTIARFAAHHAFLKHLLLWEMQQKSDSHG